MNKLFYRKHSLQLLILLAFVLQSCKKEPGEGGFASITGKVIKEDYNAYYTVLYTKYYAQGEMVYITYGDQKGVGNTVRTSYDGTYRFDYLRKGSYKVFALSKDSAFVLSDKKKEVLFQVEIKDKKQEVVLPDLVILE